MVERKGGQVLEAQLAEKVAPIAFLDLKAQFAPIRDELLSAVERVFESQHFIMGSEVLALESEIAEFVGSKFALGCASGSDALLLALMALGVGPGDEIVTTPFTFVATAGSIARMGARPVFVDIDPVTYNLDPETIESAITSKTRAIMPVHLFGLSADMAPIQEISNRHNLPVIEDAAQAIGAEYNGQRIGSLGAVGCFSFFPSKNLGAAGDGGMMVTDNPELADRLRVLRLHGSRKKYQYELLGMNSRLDTLQAAILRVKLKYLPAWTAARQRNAERSQILFSEYGLTDSIALPVVPASSSHVYNQYVIRVRHRDELKAALQKEGIPTEIYYPSPLHLQPAFAYLGYHKGDFPQAESASKEVLALPIYAELTEMHQRHVVEAIANFLRSRR
jgi:dTDP-4-amino-4,6-dideoxygalactose transaminase